MGKKQEDQNYCPVCGQPDNCGGCTHSPNAYNPQYPLTAAAVIERLNREMHFSQEKVEDLEDRLERKEEYVQNLQAQLREKQARLDLTTKVLNEERTSGHNLRSDIVRLTNSLDAAHEEYDQLHDKFMRLQERFNENLANPPVVLDLETSIKLQQEKNRLDRAVDQWKKAVMERDARVDDLKEKVKALNLENEDLRNNLINIRNTVQRHTKRV